MTAAGRIGRLRAEIAFDRSAFEQRIEELSQLDLAVDAASGRLAQVAVALHHAYGSLEAILERVARAFEGSLPDGAEWHQALLDSMALEIESIRPRVLSRPALERARQLLAFRHFFRHAYATPLDASRLGDLRRVALELAPLLRTDLDGFDQFLTDLARD